MMFTLQSRTKGHGTNLAKYSINNQFSVTSTKETMLFIPRGISVALSQHCTVMGVCDQIFFLRSRVPCFCRVHTKTS